MEDPDSGVGLPLDEKLGVQQDAMLAMTLDVFFPSAADAVEGQDKINAGYAYIPIKSRDRACPTSHNSP